MMRLPLLAAAVLLLLFTACSDMGDPVVHENQAPVAQPDGYSVVRGDTLRVDAGAGLLPNDSDPEGDALTAALVSGPDHGSLDLLPDGSFEYIHDGGEGASDAFVYAAEDPQGAGAEATVSISVFDDPDACVISVTEPADGASWPRNSLASIRWATLNAGDQVAIELYKGGIFLCEIAPSTENDGFFEWLVDPCGEGSDSDYSIRVRSTLDQGCEGFSAVFEIANPLPTVSFAGDVQPIFNTNCIVCHGFQGGMSLAPGESWNNLVGVVSNGYAPNLRVTPFDTDASVLYQKVSRNPVFGSGMPPTGPLPAANVETIRTWIEEGALNN